MFRFEVWVNNGLPEKKLQEMVEKLKIEMGCEMVEVKDIK